MKDMATPSRRMEKRSRKYTNASYICKLISTKIAIAMHKHNQSNQAVTASNKKQFKLRQITFKKGGKSKGKPNKNFSEISTASNKASREFILKSFISNDSKKTKQSGKNKQNSKGRNRDTVIHDNLGIIKEESKKVKRRTSNSLTFQNNKNIKQSDSSGYKYLNNQTIIKDGYLAAQAQAESCSRPSICSIVSDESINKGRIFGEYQQSSAKGLSSNSAAKNQHSEEPSENRRYES